MEEALAFAEKAHAVAPQFSSATGLLAGLQWLAGNRDRAEQLLQTLGDGSAYGAPMGLCHFHMIRSELDQAIEWARKAIEQRDPGILVRFGVYRFNPAMKTFAAALVPMLNLPV
jgi:hypothetical protein